MSDLLALLLHRVSHRSLLPRCWELRKSLTVYDASYIALAEQLRTTLVTADSRLASAPGLGCEVDLMARTPGGHEHPRRTTSFGALAYAVFFGWDVERLARSVVSAKAPLWPLSPPSPTACRPGARVG
jgi:hypothetical protein